MPELTNLRIEKVSLVKHPANRRSFVLLKSRDSRDASSSDDGDGGDNVNKNKEVVVKAEILQKVKEILKTERETAKVIEALKATDLEMSDAEVTEVENSLEMLKSLTPDEKKGEKKSAAPEKDEPTKKSANTPPESDPPASNEAVELLKSELESLRKELQDQRDAAHERDVVDWIKREAPYAPGKPEDIAKSLMAMEAVDKDSAKIFKDNLVQTSKALEDAQLFGEIGSPNEGDVSKSLGGEFLVAMRKARNEVKKGETKESEVEALERAVKSLGGSAYERYRKDFNRRAKLS